MLALLENAWIVGITNVWCIVELKRFIAAHTQLWLTFLTTIICVERRQMPRHQPAILNMHVHVHNMKKKHIDINHF
jgi:hypothetical protein